MIQLTSDDLRGDDDLLLRDGSHFHLGDLRMRLQALMDRAPSDAKLVFLVRESEHGYKGILRISALRGKFVAGCEESSLSRLIDQMFTEVRGQLADWRQRRYSDLGAE